MRNLSLFVWVAFFVAQISLGWGAELQDEESYDEFSTYAEETEEQEGWSEWSEWSRCSRTCDGGAAVQSRRCLHYAGCRGDSVRYKLCNLDPCSTGSKDFRAVQCSEYDGLPHEGNLYEWEPAEGEDQCALTCRAQGGGPVVTLNPRVRDGTRCKPGELDLCINGRCQTVGCDLRLGSRKRVDACGVCGGDGSTCNKPTYYWDKRANGPCSATCGGGYQMLSAVCVQQGSGRRVSEDLCDHTARPIPVILNCNDQACPTSWKVGEWGACSVSCGSGYQLREVYCEEPRNTTAVRVADHNCDPPMPRHRQPCNLHDCPRWYDGIWSQCSATCGEGIQTRVVLCRDAQGRSSRFCDDSLRPADSRMCRTGVACPPPSTLAHPRHQPYTPSWWGDEHDALASEEGVAPLMPRPQALTADQQVPAEPTYMTGNWSECSVKCGEGVRNRSVTCKIFLEFSRTVAVLPDDQCPGVKPPQSQRCVLPPCSHAMTRHDYPAGEVSDAAHDPPIASLEDAQEDLDFPEDHKIHETPFLPRLVDEDAPSTSLDVVKETSLSVPQAEAYNEPRRGLHSFEAPSNSHHQKDPLLLYTDESKGRSQYESYELSRGKSHSASEHSQINSIEIDMGGGDTNFLESYNVDVSSKASLYEWMTSGFGPCSASCLGGVQESLVKCIRIADQKIVEPQNCNREERPDIITRTCNDQSCPPRWNVSEFGECSKQCGGGVQMREVKCIHEVTRGGTNTVVVPDSLCPQPPKRTQQYCNILDCPPEWVSSDWSKCSAPCGGGIKTRTVKCQQVMALGQLEERPSRECPFRRPRDRRKCNQRPCQGGVVGTEKSIIRSQTHQDYVQSKFMKKLTLKIGGKATVFRGMRLKVKCPVRRFDRSKITWWHDGRQIGRSGAIKSTQKGVLKIKKVQYPDAGLYKCKADRSEANLTLVVIPLPSSYSSSETYETRRPSVSSANEVSLHTHEDATSTDFTYVWRPRKPGKELGRESRRRQGGRNSARRRNGFKGLQITETTLRPVQPFPIGPNTDTLGEGPFKASSKNMHTVEMTSGEATNVYDTTDWQTDSRKSDDEYVYGTVTHHMKPGVESEDTLSGMTTDHNPTHSNANQLPEEKTISEETGHIYGKVNHHSDGSRITSEENPIFGTVFHNPITGTSSRGYSPPRRTEWPSLTTSTEYHSTGTKSIYEEETGNSIEGDLKDLGNKLSLSSEHGSHIDERSRGGRHANSPSDGFGGLVSHGLVRDETTTEDPFGTPENLGKGTRDSLEFEWQMTNWSECSQTCGFTSSSSGFQVRSIQCLVRVNNVSRPVDGALCQDAGLEAPLTMQKCGLTECPQWHFDEWSECESSRCYTLNKAFQRRNVVCQLHNGTIVNSEQCDVRTRPRHRQECYNQHCTGVWRVGDWSECTAPCGGHGYRTRLLQCVWNGTKKAAGNACRELPRPEVVRWCDGQPCPDPSM